WSEIFLLEATKDKVRIIVAVPSLDTSVCDRETRHFNMEAAALGKDIAIIVISMDLPFAQERWCGAAGVDQVMVVSDHKYAEFGENYACLMLEPRLLRRAVFIVDKQNVIRYAKYMPALYVEPDYAEVLAEAKLLLKD
ncbi:MAG: thiol peroxidase, partial [Anaerolineaceae bacterium]|nr:thiol peroxidase [Anaerolineaceae bacterium]